MVVNNKENTGKSTLKQSDDMTIWQSTLALTKGEKRYNNRRKCMNIQWFWKRGKCFSFKQPLTEVEMSLFWINVCWPRENGKRVLSPPWRSKCGWRRPEREIVGREEEEDRSFTTEMLLTEEEDDRGARADVEGKWPSRGWTRLADCGRERWTRDNYGQPQDLLVSRWADFSKGG